MGEESFSEDRNHPQLLPIFPIITSLATIDISRMYYKQSKIKFIFFLAIHNYQRFMINLATNFIARLKNDYFHHILLHLS